MSAFVIRGGRLLYLKLVMIVLLFFNLIYVFDYL